MAITLEIGDKKHVESKIKRAQSPLEEPGKAASGEELQTDAVAVPGRLGPSHLGDDGHTGALRLHGDVEPQDLPLPQGTVRQEAGPLRTDVTPDSLGQAVLRGIDRRSRAFETDDLVQGGPGTGALFRWGIHKVEVTGGTPGGQSPQRWGFFLGSPFRQLDYVVIH